MKLHKRVNRLLTWFRPVRPWRSALRSATSPCSPDHRSACSRPRAGPRTRRSTSRSRGSPSSLPPATPTGTTCRPTGCRHRRRSPSSCARGPRPGTSGRSSAFRPSQRCLRRYGSAASCLTSYETCGWSWSTPYTKMRIHHSCSSPCRTPPPTALPVGRRGTSFPLTSATSYI